MGGGRGAGLIGRRWREADDVQVYRQVSDDQNCPLVETLFHKQGVSSCHLGGEQAGCLERIRDPGQKSKEIHTEDVLRNQGPEWTTVTEWFTPGEGGCSSSCSLSLYQERLWARLWAGAGHHFRNRTPFLTLPQV